MDCVLDNIIFSLQKSGGASVVWQEHISRLLQEESINLRFIEYNNAQSNFFRSCVNIPIEKILVKNSAFLMFKRYLDLYGTNRDRYIFHSSHYRLDNNKNALNITTVHDFTYEYFVKGVRQYIHSTQKWHSIRKSSGIICITESTKRDLLSFLPEIDEARVHVIHNGVSECFRPLTNNEYSLILPFENKGYILYVGSRLVPYKNFDIVVDVCKQLHIPLIMVGGEPLSLKEKNRIEEKLGYKYCIYQQVGTEQLNELYNRALLLLYPSLYEGFGIPVIEAQKAGCPVIASAASSIPEVMGDSKYSLDNISVSSIVDAVSFLDNQPGEREDEIKQGLNNSLRFSWNLTYEKTLQLYKNIYQS